ncbi:MAG: preprotein translocase subunit SecY [Eubacteriales bacterium]|nr:preprotein translocase subunit SecY [Eubacteriales bacterium]MDY3333156.1 preprotein translocase subunit SecY [Gallibacter sp.]
MKGLETLSKAWKIPDIRGKMIFTLLMLVIFRIGSNIPVPGINRQILNDAFASGNNGLMDLFNLFSGGAFGQMTIFALSITPYITASIIMQLLTIAIPSLETMAREGLEGRKKITRITRYMTVVLALIQATGTTIGMFSSALISKGFFSVALIVVVLTAGTAFLMWLGEKINESGIGNGISLIIFAGIVSRLPLGLNSIWIKLQEGSISYVTVGIFVVFAVLVIVGIIEIQQGARKIPVQYAKRVVGRKMYGGQATHIPLKVNQAGVIPVIFSLSLLQFPLTITYFMGANSSASQWITKWLSPMGSPGVIVYASFNILLIIFFTYFYTTITFNPLEVANQMKANGGFIPGIRPGTATTEYLNKVMSRITFVGAIFLAAVATLPTIVSQIIDVNIAFGGTSLLIAVGVSLDTMKKLEEQMVMRNYQGFLG